MLRSQGRHTEKVRTDLSDLGKTKDNPGTGSLKSRTEDKMGIDQDEVVHRVGSGDVYLHDHPEGQAWFAPVRWPEYDSSLKEIRKAELYFQFASCCVLRRPQTKEQNER